jgi:serine/threonine protein kinase
LYRNGSGSFYELGDSESKLADAICGEVYPGFELTHVPHEIFKVRGRKIVIKAMDKLKIQHLRRVGHRENPLREISIMQMMGNDTPHVSGLVDAVEDNTRVYSIMQHFGTELFDLAGKLSEKKIRYLFRQIVKGVQAMQGHSVCHRDISLENILISPSGKCTIIDFGLALIVPQMKQKTITSVLSSLEPQRDHRRGDSPSGLTDEEESLESSSIGAYEEEEFEDEDMDMGIDMDMDMEDEDTSEHSAWRDSDAYVPVMLLPQGNCGKENYVAPEILVNRDPFDALVVDNWALGVLLFMLFTGRPPFIRATRQDQYFQSVQQNRLRDILKQWRVEDSISPQATDLLERMLQAENPKSRMTCRDILAHPWMAKKHVAE